MAKDKVKSKFLQLLWLASNPSKPSGKTSRPKRRNPRNGGCSGKQIIGHNRKLCLKFQLPTSQAIWVSRLSHRRFYAILLTGYGYGRWPFPPRLADGPAPAAICPAIRNLHRDTARCLARLFSHEYPARYPAQNACCRTMGRRMAALACAGLVARRRNRRMKMFSFWGLADITRSASGNVLQFCQQFISGSGFGFGSGFRRFAGRDKPTRNLNQDGIWHAIKRVTVRLARRLRVRVISTHQVVARLSLNHVMAVKAKQVGRGESVIAIHHPCPAALTRVPVAPTPAPLTAPREKQAPLDGMPTNRDDRFSVALIAGDGLDCLDYLCPEFFALYFCHNFISVFSASRIRRVGRKLLAYTPNLTQWGILSTQYYQLNYVYYQRLMTDEK
jgi:hypothetical protein